MRLGGCGHTPVLINPPRSYNTVARIAALRAGSWGPCSGVASHGDFRSCCPIPTGQTLIWGIGRQSFERQGLSGVGGLSNPSLTGSGGALQEPCLPECLSWSLTGN